MLSLYYKPMAAFATLFGVFACIRPDNPVYAEVRLIVATLMAGLGIGLIIVCGALWLLLSSESSSPAHRMLAFQTRYSMAFLGPLASTMSLG